MYYKREQIAYELWFKNRIHLVQIKFNYYRYLLSAHISLTHVKKSSNC